MEPRVIRIKSEKVPAKPVDIVRTPLTLDDMVEIVIEELDLALLERANLAVSGVMRASAGVGVAAFELTLSDGSRYLFNVSKR